MKNEQLSRGLKMMMFVRDRVLALHDIGNNDLARRLVEAFNNLECARAAIEQRRPCTIEHDGGARIKRPSDDVARSIQEAQNAYCEVDGVVRAYWFGLAEK